MKRRGVYFNLNAETKMFLISLTNKNGESFCLLLHSMKRRLCGCHQSDHQPPTSSIITAARYRCLLALARQLGWPSPPDDPAGNM